MKAKLRAYVGKYLMTLAKFPLHNERAPSVEIVLVKQLAIPVNLGISPD